MWKTFRESLTSITVVVLAGVIAWEHFAVKPNPTPDQAVNAVALGKSYGPVLASSYGDAWVLAADAVDNGKSIAEAQKVLQDSWKDARAKEFKAVVEPGFSLVLPAGTEPSDAAKRTQVSSLWRDFAKGLKGAR